MFADPVPRRPRRRRATLLGRILLWMIVPLFVLWSIGIVITYFISLNIANSPYDRTLASHLRLLRHEVEQQRLAGGVALSESARTVLAGSADESATSWQILDANGHLLAGDPSIPTPENWGYDIDQIRFRNASLNHQSIRMAYVWGGRDQDGTGFLTVVAEPAEARATLQQEILTGMLTPQLIILPLAAMLAGLGLTQGLEPLSLLQEHMRRRKPSDLSPIHDDLAPAEIVPLIASMNNVLQRLSDSIESQRRFVANAAHQLKTPLAGIRTQCELALREQLSVREHMSIVPCATACSSSSPAPSAPPGWSTSCCCWRGRNRSTPTSPAPRKCSTCCRWPRPAPWNGSRPPCSAASTWALNRPASPCRSSATRS